MVLEGLAGPLRGVVAGLVLAGLVLLSALLAGTEAALLSFPRHRRNGAAEPDAAHRRVEKLLEHPQRIVLTVALATVALDLGAAAFAALLLAPGLGEGLAGVLVAAAGALVVLAVAKVLPKAYAAEHAEGWSRAAAAPFGLLCSVLGPLVGVYLGVSSGIAKLAGSGEAHTGAYANEEELKTLITIGAEEGIIEDQEEEMIHSVLEFGDTTAREIMVPRADIVAVPADATIEHVRAFVLDAGYSRLPTYQGSLDNIVGVALAKDMLVALVDGKGATQVRDLMKDPLFVPETTKLDWLLRQMREKRMHLALVVDEFGSLTGLVTLEDLVEEIIGDISDEHDLRTEPIKKLDERTALVDARTHVEDINAALGTEIPEDGPYDTVGGFVFHRLGRLGREGESVREKGTEVVVDKVVNRRILRVKVLRHDAAPGRAARGEARPEEA